MLTGLASADTGHGDKNSVGREQIAILNNPKNGLIKRMIVIDKTGRWYVDTEPLPL